MVISMAVAKKTTPPVAKAVAPVAKAVTATQAATKQAVAKQTAAKQTTPTQTTSSKPQQATGPAWNAQTQSPATTASVNRANYLINQAAKATTEAEANNLIMQAQAYAQKTGNAGFFELVTRQAQGIQAKNVAQRSAVGELPIINDAYMPTYGGGGTTTPSPVLIPGRDALNFATSGVIDSLTSFIFEDLAGTEIISLMKRDTIDGIDPNYSIISNISDVRMSVDPTSLLSKKTKTDSYFDVFGIQLLDKIPGNEYLAKNSIHDFYYIASNGDLVIELDNLGVDERIDVEIATNGTIKELDN